jgi:hypothetical protein
MNEVIQAAISSLEAHKANVDAALEALRRVNGTSGMIATQVAQSLNERTNERKFSQSGGPSESHA